MRWNHGNSFGRKKEHKRGCWLLKQDEVVAFPTETVFGLGVKFGNLSALEKIYEIKHRSHSKAVSLMIYDSQDIEKYAYVNTNAQKLIDEFMPGMITLV